MPLFGKKKKEEGEGKKEKVAHVICPHCYLDFEVEQIEQAGGVCPSCKGKIDLEKAPRAYM